MKVKSILDYYKFVTDSLNDGKDPLMEIILNKPKWYQFSKRLYIKNFKLYLATYYTPSFDFLACIADFIITAENTFMYPNCKDSDIMAYRNTKNETKSFAVAISEVIDGKEYIHTIEYTLFKRDNNRINIKISRKWGENIATNISFYSDQDMKLSVNDQIMFDNIISDTMAKVIKLFDYCLNKAKSINYEYGNSEDSFTHS